MFAPFCASAQLMAIRAGIGIGFCQAALARRDPNLEHHIDGLRKAGLPEG
jgi:hypothetical protein